MTLLINSFQVGTGASAFNPLTQVTALHAVWADDPSWSTGKPSDGGPITQIRNESGTNLTALGGSPTWRASVSALGNKAAYEFDGVDDVLTADPADQAQPFKGVAVFRYTTVAANVTPFGYTSGAAAGFGLNASSRYMINNGTNLVVGSGTADTAGHVHRATSNSTGSSQLWVDGTSIIGPGDSGAGAFARFRLGAGGTSTISRYAACQVAFAAVYDGATSDTDLATLAADLKTYYGL